MGDRQTNPLERLDPELAIRPGSFDAHAVLFLWCVRKSFWPTVWLGFSVALIAMGDLEVINEQLENFDSPQTMLANLLSPLGLLVAAFVIRIISNWTALAAAFPLTLSTRREHYESGNRVSRWFHLLWDRLYQARAYRALRQTWAVRERAHIRLQPNDRVYKLCEFGLAVANPVFLITWFVVLSLLAANSPN